MLWFATVGSGGKGFQHLVGNVAEFVFQPPAGLDEKLQELPKSEASKAAATFLKLVQDHAASLRVIGGSALSAPEVWDGKGKPFGKAWPVELVKGARDSYSDVGFRLAFTAPRETPADQLRRILRRRGYLMGSAN